MSLVMTPLSFHRKVPGYNISNNPKYIDTFDTLGAFTFC